MKVIPFEEAEVIEDGDLLYMYVPTNIMVDSRPIEEGSDIEEISLEEIQVTLVAIYSNGKFSVRYALGMVSAEAVAKNGMVMVNETVARRYFPMEGIEWA